MLVCAPVLRPIIAEHGSAEMPPSRGLTLPELSLACHGLSQQHRVEHPRSSSPNVKLTMLFGCMLSVMPVWTQC